jgi:outer membrane immunogenic protein
MRKVVLVVATLVFKGSAFAADLPLKASPTIASVPTWSGCFAGANFGGARQDLSFERVAKINGTPAPADVGSQSASSVAGGGQLGCDLQTSNWVFGFQGLFDFTDLSGSNAVPPFPEFTITNSNRWFAMATGRIGYTVTPSLLFYARGGAAFVEDHLALSGTLVRFAAESADGNRSGWTVGGGFEWMFMPTVSLSVEYMHMDFGTKNVAFTASPGTTSLADIIATKQKIDTVMAGVNWHFWTPNR